MSAVSIRELRNNGGDVVDRVARGESITITRNGRPVAELTPLGKPPATRDVLVEHRRSLPPVDPAALRRDVDELLDTSL
jgi:prevent-host-death family protein